MDTNEFQKHALRTWNVGMDDNDQLLNAALGLCGEAGEFAEMVKKAIFHKQGLDAEKAKKELGDILYYVSAAAVTLGFSLSEIAEANVEKLKRRYPNGFEPKSHDGQ